MKFFDHHDELNDAVEFFCPFQINENGSFLADAPNVSCPESVIDDLAPQGWTFVNGFSRQDRYAGPTMHASEYLGGAMARHVVETPGVYVLVESYSTNVCDDEDPFDEPAGWCLLRQVEDGIVLVGL